MCEIGSSTDWATSCPRSTPTPTCTPQAAVIGAVTIGADSSIWPCAVLRGDREITIGERTSIQDGTVVHCGPGFPTVIGDGCVVGHLAHLEGCRLEDGSLVGSGSVVLHHAVDRLGGDRGGERRRAQPHGRPPRGPRRRGAGRGPKEGASHPVVIEFSAADYVENARVFKGTLERLD